MFKILDGREHFFQWDLNQKLIIEDASINEVHFCNKTDECSLVCEVYEDNGQRVVNVPNILFQNDWTIRAYAYQVDHTLVEQRYKVFTRTKPADYVYTETEVKDYSRLEAKVDAMEKNIGQTVEDYLKENPIEMDGYATEKYVDDAISAIDIPETDLTGYATEKYVDDAIAAIDIPTPEASVEEISISANEPTDENIKVWINPDAIGDEFALKSDIPDISGLATKGEIPDVSGFTTMGAVEAKGYQTETQVNTLINEALGVIENGTY